MLTLMPSASSRRAAAAPSVVPGTLIITFGRSTTAHSRRASAIVSSTLCAEPGETSIETNPSVPLLFSCTGRKMSHAARTSSVSTSSNSSHALSSGERARELRVVRMTLGQRLLEDRRVRRHPGEGIALDAPRELAAAKQRAVDEVEPDGLTRVVELL